MKFKSRNIGTRSGFTMVELTAVIVVVAVLVSLLIPAINGVQKSAKNLRQRAQFASIEIALESFKNDHRDYPESIYNAVSSASVSKYGGAQKLAEAMVGLDGFGFHPDSLWNADGTDGSAVPMYQPGLGNITGITQAEIAANLEARSDLYLELETSNITKVDDIYPDSVLGVHVAPGTFVLSDMFKKVKNISTGEKTGMPILYFKAYLQNTDQPHARDLAGNSSNPYSSANDDLTNSTIRNYRYCISDCKNFISLDAPFDGTRHPMNNNNNMDFYDAVAHPDFTGVPYRSDSYILLSAGADGYYGTEDDVYNFNPLN